MEKNKNVIEIQDVTISYNDRKAGLKAIINFSLEINRGEFIVIVGPSGCGKSTILKAISDTLEPIYSEVKGRISVLNNAPQTAREQRKVGFVFQKPTLLQWRNVERNISLPLEIIGTPKEERKKKVFRLLKMIDLEEYAQYHPDQLSGGMQQKISIARALAYDPDILLMDEPFGALDEINRRKMNDELIKLWEKTEKTIAFVTHSIEEAVYLGQRVVVLTKQPGTLKNIIPIELHYPRRKEMNTIKFFNYVNKIRRLLENEYDFNEKTAN